ncbi:MAG TPA: SDR family oxidoreductase [Arenibaculum sp.]|nr:SDR family oxidoreductase [Arenibaculum sp.]
MADFRDKVVWITGASSGIGAALARAFAARGARLVLSARRMAALEAVRAGCAGDPARIRLVPLDLADHAALPERARDALGQFGRIDILVNNGGISQRSLVKDTALEVDRRLIDVNYLGTVALTKAVLPHFLEQGRGHIVTVTSLVGIFGTPMRSGYSASKHALHGFFDSLRAELADTGIRVSLVCPGFIRTDVSINALTADGSAQGTLDRAQAEGMDPDACAVRILAGIAAGRREILVGGREVMGVHLARWFPGLFARLVSRARVT